MPKKKQPYNFEKTLQTLDNLIETMEQGSLSLEESLTSFEQGVKLTRECQAMLNQAEQKVQLLISQESSINIEPLE